MKPFLILFIACGCLAAPAEIVRDGWFEEMVPMGDGVLRVDVAGACAQFAPHSNVKGDQFAIREPKVAHNRVFAAESELVLRVIGE